MKNNNEITIKINFSDSLLNKMANILLLSSSPPPFGMLMPQGVGQIAKAKTPRSIGFKK